MNALQGLSAWNRACELAVHTCAVVRDCADRNFQDQITRASLAVPASIADGYERTSAADYRHFLEAAKGACAGLRTQLYIAGQLDLITLQASTDLMQESLELTRQLQRLIAGCDTDRETTADSGETDAPYMCFIG